VTLRVTRYPRLLSHGIVEPRAGARTTRGFRLPRGRAGGRGRVAGPRPGGTPGPVADVDQGEGWDHSTPYLRRILGDWWQADLTVIERELTLAATTPAMEGLKDLAAQRHAEALDAARHTGRSLAAK